MTEVTMEKPVVSKELAEAFETLSKTFIASAIIDNSHLDYKDTPEYLRYKKSQSYDLFESLLAKMYVLGYEVEKPKKYAIKPPVTNVNGESQYITKCYKDNGEKGYLFLFNCEDDDAHFTKAEIESDEGLKKLASVCELVEVED